MQPAQQYNPGLYAPSERFAQFGDDVLRQTLNAHHDAWQKLSAKREGMQQLHADRLQQDGFAPMPRGPYPSTPAEHPQAPPDPEEDATMHYDRPSPPPPPPRPRFSVQRSEVARYEPPEMHEMGTQGGPPPPPKPGFSVQRSEVTRYEPPEMHEMGTQGGPPPPPKPGMRAERGPAARYDPPDAMHVETHHGHPPPPGPPGSYAPVKERLGPYAGSSSSGAPPPPPLNPHHVVPVYHLPDQDQEMALAHSGSGPPKPPRGGKKVRMEDVEPIKRRAEDDIGEQQKEHAFAAAHARRNENLKQKLADSEKMAGAQGMQLQHSQQMKDAEAEQKRQHEASLRNLTHEVNVLRGHVERGRSNASAAASTRAPSAATTRLYETVRHHSAETIQASHATTDARSRSPLLPVDTGSVGERSKSPVPRRRIKGKRVTCCKGKWQARWSEFSRSTTASCTTEAPTCRQPTNDAPDPAADARPDDPPWWSPELDSGGPESGAPKVVSQEHTTPRGGGPIRST